MNASATPARIEDVAEPAADTPRHFIFRHRLSTRLWHWLNGVVLVIMLMSGLMIFNAHPRLYWGQYGANNDPAWLEIGATPTGGQVLLFGSVEIPVGGVLGRWRDRNGAEQTRAFPWWATIPSDYSLAGARRWHLSVAWLFSIATIAYLLWSAFNGHIRRDLAPRRHELKPSYLWADIKNHLRARFHGDEPGQYNILQKLSYASVLFVMLPLMILTGLTMSPAFNAAWPWMLDLFGGRQSARSIHFICAAGLVAFTAIHLLLVLLAGPVNEIRSMITGWFGVQKIKEDAA